MCGRFFRTEVSYEEYLAHFDLSRDGEGGFPGTEAAYNVAPTQTAPVVRRREGGTQAEVAFARWGLVPFWWNKPIKEMKFSTFNARSETAATSRVFRHAYRHRRCLVPVSGYYEWSGPRGRKTPYAIGCRNRRWFCLGGLWEKSAIDGSDVESFTILTTTPNELMAGIHNRMPVIVHPGNYARWLDADCGDVAELCSSYPAEEMEAWIVGAAVGNVRNQGRELIAEA